MDIFQPFVFIKLLRLLLLYYGMIRFTVSGAMPTTYALQASFLQ